MTHGPAGGSRNAITAGVILAALAALAFGATTPFIRLLGREVGPLLTASLLYAGAFLGALPNPWTSGMSSSRVTRAHLPRLAVVALLGAAIAPALLAIGLQRVSAVQGSLLLNFEAVFTILFAWLVAREAIGARVIVAGALMFVAGALTVFGGGVIARPDLPGVLAVTGAVAAWAMDNVLTRPLAQLAPASVVRWKAAMGAALTLSLGLVLGDPRPGVTSAIGLLLCGMTGYGISLRLYLMAQSRVGAARTGSVFAIAPFVGAALALGIERRMPDWGTVASAALFGLGVYLHLTERHGHVHDHHAITHDHEHRHDDGHHEHHREPPSGEHGHVHRHDQVTHEHEHAPDVHHEHRHAKKPPGHDQADSVAFDPAAYLGHGGLMKYVVLGESTGASMEAVMAVYPRHEKLVKEFIDRGVVIGIGPFSDRGNMAIFRTREAAEEFARSDPFYLEGLVKQYTVREWHDSLIPET